MQDFKAIIWDYNGTLLDDMAIGLQSINLMLKQRGMPLLSTDRYREVFMFPVKDYYKKVGFDFSCENWDLVANEFISNYTSLLPETQIFPRAIELLAHFNNSGKKQFILSAMEQTMLDQSVNDENISKYFDEISGIDNIYASSKIENGKKMIQKHQLIPQEVCLLGDTEHDFEVSRELGCQCILIAAGHQSFKKLKNTGCSMVISHLGEIAMN